MDFFSNPGMEISPTSIGDGKVCSIVKTAINCSGSSSNTNCPTIGSCTQGSC